MLPFLPSLRDGRRLLLTCMLLGSCSAPAVDHPPSADVSYTESRESCTDRTALRRLYFGDLHAHTRNSWDAYGYGLKVTPEQALGFARGESVMLPRRRIERIDRPLDFAALTDHSEFFGELDLCRTPGSSAYATSACTSYRQLGEAAVVSWGMLLIWPDGTSRQAEICGTDGKACETAARRVWKEVQTAAESAYDRTAACAFASFVGYEYTATPLIANQHRNVIFRNASVTDLPVTYYEQPGPLGLWSALAEQCLDAGGGCDVLVIPHNANWSNGNLFATPASSSMTEEEIVALRARLEPLFEVMQHKGDQECTPGLDSAPTSDAQCRFEKTRFPPLTDCEDAPGWGGVKDLGCISRLDFLRGVLSRGLADEARLGRNTLRLGVIGSTDTHNGTPGNTSEKGWPGHVGLADDTAAERLGPGNSTHRGLVNNPGGLAAVWAVERSRDAIFEALRRREVYSTSGTRIEVRFFGGWRADGAFCSAPDAIEQGYRRGVPMGGVLDPRPSDDDGAAPVFFLLARADLGTAARPGARLAVAQVVKGWIDESGAAREKVYEVAGSEGSGGSADTKTCAPSAGGEETLCAVWRDPDFDPSLRAFYYARVLETPTCRWSTFECNAYEPSLRPSGCSDKNVEKLIQERAITSAIWYSP
jgi:hypothetical protein